MTGTEFLPASGRPVSRWANGGGVTREVFALAGPAGFHWRVSLAEVARSGPFSVFPGVDRTIVLISAGELALDLFGRVVALNRWEPFDFAGDSPALGLLGSEATVDLNVMVNRAYGRASVEVAVVGDGILLDAGTERLVIALEGRVRFAGSDWAAELAELDAVRSDGRLSITALDSSRVAVIAIEPT